METKLNSKLDRITETVQNLQESVEFLGGKYDDVMKEKDEMKQELNDIKKQNEVLQSEVTFYIYYLY